MTEPENTEQEQGNGRFRKGQSGNPKGKAPGTRNTALVAMDRIGEESAQDLIRSVIAKAQDGDMTAARIVLDRAWPVRKGRPVMFTMPPVSSAADTAKALSGVLEAVAGGLLSIEEGQGLAAILEAQRKALELTEIEERLTVLENQHKQVGKP